MVYAVSHLCWLKLYFVQSISYVLYPYTTVFFMQSLNWLLPFSCKWIGDKYCVSLCSDHVCMMQEMGLAEVEGWKKESWIANRMEATYFILRRGPSIVGTFKLCPFASKWRYLGFIFRNQEINFCRSLFSSLYMDIYVTYKKEYNPLP